MSASKLRPAPHPPKPTAFVAALEAAIRAAPADKRTALAIAIDETWGRGAEEFSLTAAKAFARSPRAAHALLTMISDAASEP